jgi:hypothetical protein
MLWSLWWEVCGLQSRQVWYAGSCMIGSALRTAMPGLVGTTQKTLWSGFGVRRTGTAFSVRRPLVPTSL